MIILREAEQERSSSLDQYCFSLHYPLAFLLIAVIIYALSTHQGGESTNHGFPFRPKW